MTQEVKRHRWSRGQIANSGDPRVRAYYDTMDRERARFVAALKNNPPNPGLSEEVSK
jgi:hypothetical protein